MNIPKSISYERKKTVIIELNETLLLLRSGQMNPDDIKIGN